VTPLRELGEDLRAARERRGISLSTIAATTKISRTLLEGLERGDCSRWPGGIYNRSYVRDYARAVGLPPDEIVRRFVACLADAALPAPSPGAPAAVPASPLRLTLATDAAEARTTWLLRARLLVLDVAIAVGGAAIVASTTDVNFWIAAAAAMLCCHATGVFRTGTSLGSSTAAGLRGAGLRASAETPAEPELRVADGEW
jgi:transcriptional regulator with XRE-family HTH domain